MSLLTAPAYAAEPVKSAQQCSSEMHAKMKAIKAAGETLPRFFHDCWWKSTPGKPTVIVEGGTIASPAPSVAHEPNGQEITRRPAAIAPVRVAHRKPPREYRLARAVPERTRAGLVPRPLPRRTEVAHRFDVGRPSRPAFASAERPRAHATVAWSANPPGFSEARRIWIRQAGAMGEPGALSQAVIVEPVRPGAMEPGGLRCWTQPVLFERRRHQRSWHVSLACDGLTAPWSPPEAPRVSFAGYASSRTPRVARRETWYE